MPQLGSLVSGDPNEPLHEKAMVKLMLRLIKNKRGASYFAHDYIESKLDRHLGPAISAFQRDQGLLGPRPGTMPAGPPEVSGQVAPGGRTWMALVEAFGMTDRRYRQARTLEGVAVAYLPMVPSLAGTNAAELLAVENLDETFKQNVATLIHKFYAKSEIAVSLTKRTGGWRTFSGQQGLSSNAGYGESIHQFGYAVDLGFAGLRCISPDLTIQESDPYLGYLEKPNVRQFFGVRNALAAQFGLHGTILEGDMGHLQAFDDDTLNSVGSLMALMTAVGPRRMKWEPKWKTPTDYWCDLGLGGPKYYVGTANDIWNESQVERISAADLAAALNARKKAEPSFSVEKFLGPSDPLPAVLAASDITEEHLKAVQTMLKGELLAAATNWKRWKPIRYPDSRRRPDNPRPRKKR